MSSPLDRLRAAYEARQRAHVDHVDLFDDGTLVAQVGLIDDGPGARALGVMVARLQSDDAGDLTNDELAQVVASATRGLHYRDDDGEVKPLTGESGTPVTFGNIGAEVLDMPGITDPVDGVKVTFTVGSDDGPPQIDAARLLMVATTILDFVVEAPVPGR